MKNISKYIILAASALAALACSKTLGPEELTAPDSPAAGTKGTKVTIIGREAPETKAIHGTDIESGESTFKWFETEDQLGVYTYNSQYEYWSGEFGYRFMNSETGDIAKFVPYKNTEVELNVGDRITGFYLWGNAYATSTYTADGEAKTVLRSNLSSLLQLGNNDTGHLTYGDYMVTKSQVLTEDNFDSEGNVTLEMQFRHIFSKIRFTVRNSTSEPLDIYSVIYRSTCESDILQGTLYMDIETGDIVTPEYYEYGDVQPSNSGVLEVQDVRVQPGEDAYLWLWMLPYDFSEGNSADRKADVMVNTSAGVFRVQDIVFNQPFEAGKVYRQGMELTPAKLLSDYAYVSDPNFVKMLWEGPMSSGDSYCPVYNLDLTPMDSPSSDYSVRATQLSAITSGRFIRPSEAKTVTEMQVNGFSNNMLSLDGLQYFTGLKNLTIMLNGDMSTPMSLKAFHFETLTELENLNILQSQIRGLDLSKNKKLKSVDLGTAPYLEYVTGLENLYELESFSVREAPIGVHLDFRRPGTIKKISISIGQNEVFNTSYTGRILMHDLSLDVLELSLPSTMDECGVSVKNLSAKSVACDLAFPEVVQGVERLTFMVDKSTVERGSIVEQLNQMDQLRYFNLSIYSGALPEFSLPFTPAQSKIDTLLMTIDRNLDLDISGWSNLTSLDTLFYYGPSLQNADLSASTLHGAKIYADAVDLKIPGTAKRLELDYLKTGVSLEPKNLEYLDIRSNKGSITLGDAPALKTLWIEAGGSGNTLTLGSAPSLEFFHLESYYANSDNGCFEKINWADSYPSLKTLSVGGTNIHRLPSGAVLPALADLTIGGVVGYLVHCGIGEVDLREYPNLTNFKVTNLSMNYPYNGSSNRYYDEDGYLRIRMPGSFTLSDAQWEAIKAGTFTVSGYRSTTATLDGNPVKVHYINSDYGKKDAEGNIVSLQDFDYSDGEITYLEQSNT